MKKAIKKSLYVIGEKKFTTLHAIREYVRELRDSYNDKEFLNPLDLSFMVDLLKRHESANFKIGCGIKAMYVKTHPRWNKIRGFWLVRNDGTETDFSFEMCLRNKKEPKLLKFKAACRTIVIEDIKNFRHEFFRDKKIRHCPFTGEIITPAHSHVDHIAPWTFERIISDFIKKFSIDVEAVDIIGVRQDGIMENDLYEPLRQTFLDFHRYHAKLQVVSPIANLSLLKKER